MGGIFWKKNWIYVKTLKDIWNISSCDYLKLLTFVTEHIHVISPTDPAMVKGPDNLRDFNPYGLPEGKVSCRLLTAVKKQILIGPCLLISERSSVMTCSNIKFYEIWTKTRQEYEILLFTSTFL